MHCHVMLALPNLNIGGSSISGHFKLGKLLSGDILAPFLKDTAFEEKQG